jgi:chorismate mutase
MTKPSPDMTLDAIRREIDTLDDQILNLLEHRFAATRRVKESKARDGSINSSPFRPSREAEMLRRLVGRSGAAMSPDVLVRIWRVILSASTQLQAPVTLHLDVELGGDLDTRLLISQHFCGMSVALHSSPSHALAALQTSQGDLAVLSTTGNWALGYLPETKGAAQVIGTLPAVSRGSQPRLLVFGHAVPQETGDDETLVLSPGPLPELASALWQAVSGRFTLSSLPGFLTEKDSVLDSVLRRGGACVAGRCPRPIKVS